MTVGVLVTRPYHQAQTLCNMLVAENITPYVFPTIAIAPIPHDQQIKWNFIKKNDALIFTSVNAVTHFFKAGEPGDITVDIFAIGEATQAALSNLKIKTTTTPKSPYNSEALIEAMLPTLNQYRTIGIITGKDGRPFLAKALREKNLSVDILAVYARTLPKPNLCALEEWIHAEKIDIITFTSVVGLEYFGMLVPEDLKASCLSCQTVVATQDMAKIIKAQRFEKAPCVAQSAMNAAIVKAIKQII